ncbi:hypothetical protein [Olsenella sp. Marseille-P4559]|uniref:hypothetical protein n=1 Tax=Olsenella sp. Marseille-P4559 TaxID=2364795 RepID=UPI0010300537|nr:hypothetical protein [Olsenella sp. Marseille-P4559]
MRHVHYSPLRAADRRDRPDGTGPSAATGLEADAAIELVDGRWAALEAETSEARVGGGVASLGRLCEELIPNADARVRPPEFMAVITGVSEYAHLVEQGVCAVPTRALTA